MSLELPGRRRFHLDGSQVESTMSGTGHGEHLFHSDDNSAVSSRLLAAIERSRDCLLHQQDASGFWVGELEGDTILESEYVLLLAYLGQADSLTARRCGNYILKKQLSGGGWAIFPGGPLEVSASVKAYWALKITRSE